jgi:hypothetical protein
LSSLVQSSPFCTSRFRLSHYWTLTATDSAGYPIISFFTTHHLSDLGGFNVGGINGSGQIPSMPGNLGLIDLDTPQEAYTMPSYLDGTDMQLIFSDEFNTDGRTFYPGDDPYWEAVDLHYWQVNACHYIYFAMPHLDT